MEQYQNVTLHYDVPTLAVDLTILVTHSSRVQFLVAERAVEAALVPALSMRSEIRLV